jgi:hypothetical protein
MALASLVMCDGVEVPPPLPSMTEVVVRKLHGMSWKTLCGGVNKLPAAPTSYGVTTECNLVISG